MKKAISGYKMRPRLTLLIICVLSSFASIAQPAKTGTWSGTVIDSAGQKPLASVSVLITDSAGAAVNNTTTTENGSFKITAPVIKGKRLSLTISFVGYVSKTILLTAEEKDHDLGSLFLSGNTGQLQNVTVTAGKPLVKQEIDRISYDVQSDPQSKGQSVMDMLRRVPLITVDGDDNIQLQGSGNYRIFLNGKPSALVTSNPKDVLKSMPANLILRIEVITTPPAKYEAEGLAGIINIITAKKTDNGYNGTVSVRENINYGAGLNVSVTAKQGKFGISGYGGTGIRPMLYQDNQYLRKTYGTAPETLTQAATSSSNGHYVFTGSELSYEIDSLNLLTGSLNYFKGKNSQDYDRYSNYFQPDGTMLQSYRQFNNGGYNYNNIDLGFNYQLGFKKKKEQLLTASYSYSYSLNGQFSELSVYDRFKYYQPDNNQQNDAGYHEHTFQVDYVHPIKKLTIEAGAKTVLRDNYSYSQGQVYDAVNGFVPDLSRTNNFTYRQDINGLYNSYSLKFDKWSFKGGVRAEFTGVSANFSSTGTLLDMHYSNLIPSLSILHNLPNNNSITFGITNRLMRPYIQQLNPFVDRTNPQLISSGNPNLLPVISHLFEISHNMTGKFSLNTRISYMYTNNSIESVTKVVADTLSQTTYENVGKSRIARLNLNGSYNFNPNWSANFNTGVFYVWISGTYNGHFFTNQGPRTNTFVNTNYKLPKNWQIGFSAGYNRRYITLQGSSNDYYYLNFSATKTIKKFTFTTVLVNPFQRYYPFTQYTDTPDFYQSNTQNGVYRNMSFNISYKFGKLNSSIKKNQRGIVKDDATSSN